MHISKQAASECRTLSGESLGRGFARSAKRNTLARKHPRVLSTTEPPPPPLNLPPPPAHSDGCYLGTESDQPWSSDSSPTSVPSLLGTGAAHNLPLARREPEQEKRPTLPCHAGHGKDKRTTGKPSANLHGRLCPGEWRSGVRLCDPRPEYNKALNTAHWYQHLHCWTVCHPNGLQHSERPAQYPTPTPPQPPWSSNPQSCQTLSRHYRLLQREDPKTEGNCKLRSSSLPIS